MRRSIQTVKCGRCGRKYPLTGGESSPLCRVYCVGCCPCSDCADERREDDALRASETARDEPLVRPETKPHKAAECSRENGCHLCDYREV